MSISFLVLRGAVVYGPLSVSSSCWFESSGKRWCFSHGNLRLDSQLEYLGS